MMHLTGSLWTTDEKRRRPIDIARERHHQHLYEILTADRLPEVSDDDLMRVETHFHALIVQEPGDAFKTESMRFPDLGMLRDLPKVWMPIPGMYGVRFFFSFRFFTWRVEFAFLMMISVVGLHFLVGGWSFGDGVLLPRVWRFRQDEPYHS
jgi:hypothetical protein